MGGSFWGSLSSAMQGGKELVKLRGVLSRGDCLWKVDSSSGARARSELREFFQVYVLCQYRQKWSHWCRWHRDDCGVTVRDRGTHIVLI